MLFSLRSSVRLPLLLQAGTCTVTAPSHGPTVRAHSPPRPPADDSSLSISRVGRAQPETTKSPEWELEWAMSGPGRRAADSDFRLLAVALGPEVARVRVPGSRAASGRVGRRDRDGPAHSRPRRPVPSAVSRGAWPLRRARPLPVASTEHPASRQLVDRRPSDGTVASSSTEHTKRVAPAGRTRRTRWAPATPPRSRGLALPPAPATVSPEPRPPARCERGSDPPSHGAHCGSPHKADVLTGKVRRGHSWRLSVVSRQLRTRRFAPPLKSSTRRSLRLDYREVAHRSIPLVDHEVVLPGSHSLAGILFQSRSAGKMTPASRLAASSTLATLRASSHVRISSCCLPWFTRAQNASISYVMLFGCCSTPMFSAWPPLER